MMEQTKVKTKIAELDQRIEQHWLLIQSLVAGGEDPKGELLSKMAEKHWKLFRERDFWYSLFPENHYDVRRAISNIYLS